MSGHSKWHRIKRKKAATDNKRGQEFTRLAGQITSAARDNPNPDQNSILREAITRAKQANMPQHNIDKLLQRAIDSPQQNIHYEAFGPGGAALVIIANTDNPKRTVAELRAILKKSNATLGQPNSVLWKFNQSSPGQLTAKYIQTLDENTNQQVKSLVQELKNHPDVQSIFTDLQNHP